MSQASEQIAKQFAAAANVKNIWKDIIINVKDYGAKGSPTDDTAAFQAAINYANSVGMTEITIPAGSYTYGTLTNTTGIVFVGDGVTITGTTKVPLVHVAQLADIAINVKSFGAVGDGVTDDTIAIQNAIDSLGLYNTLLIPEGVYVVSSLVYNKSFTTVVCDGEILSTTTDVAFLISCSNSVFHKLRVKRSFTNTGVAKNDLLYKGVVIRNSKNITLYSPDVRNFKRGINVDSDSSVGCAYIDIYAPMLFDNLISYSTTTSNDGWSNETHVFGGRMHIGGFSDYTETAYCDLVGDCHRFIGIALESANVERKIKGNFSECAWSYCRFEGSNGICDIEIVNNGNKLIWNRDLENIIVNTGIRNVISTSWKTETSIITGSQPKTWVSTSALKDFTVTVDNNCYLVDSSEVATGISLPVASDKYLRYVPITIKKIDSTNNIVSINAGLSRLDHTIRIAKLTFQGESITVMSDGERYRVIGDYTFGETTATSGFDTRTFGIGSEIRNDNLSTTLTYASKICVQAGTNGSASVNATGTSGSNTVTIAGTDVAKVEKGQYITIATAGDYIITAKNGDVITLNGTLPGDVTSQAITFRAPVFRKKDRVIIEMTAAPTTGTWAKGDIVYNSNPTAGGKIGWVCITAGTPGTWKAFGTIDA